MGKGLGVNLLCRAVPAVMVISIVQMGVAGVPRITVGKALPSERLGLPQLSKAMHDTSPSLGVPELSQETRKELWQAFGEAQRQIQRLTERQAEVPANLGVHFFASNPGHELSVRFRSDGALIQSKLDGKDWQCLFRLVNGKIPQTIAAKGTRLEYDYGEIIEWYDNRSDGLEQGFVLVKRPVDEGDTVELGVTVEGLAPQTDVSGDLYLVDTGGQAVLSYGKLKVWDSDGTALPARLHERDGSIVIAVAVSGARFPICIDPLIVSQETILEPIATGDGAVGDRFGCSVALSGDTALVGAFMADDNGESSGSAYVFLNTGGVWHAQAKLTAEGGSRDDYFGYSVSLSGNRALVGAYGDYSGGSGGGAAYIFERDAAGTWGQVARLTANDAAALDAFGHSVSLSGDIALVGASGDDDRGDGSGSAYIFGRGTGGSWGQLRKLTASDGAALDAFGNSVSLSGDTALVGAWGNDDQGGESGSAYVFQRGAAGPADWSETRKLTPSDGTTNDQFGVSVAVAGDIVLVGAHLDDARGIDSGSTYVFERDEGGPGLWGETRKLIAGDGGGQSAFGASVSLSGNLALVGAWGHDGGGSDAGCAYIYERDEGGTSNWGQVKKLIATDGVGFDQFGGSVSVSGTRALVGTHLDDDHGDGSGSVYLYDRDRGGMNNWGQWGKLTAGDSAAGDNFGDAVAISGDIAIVGAPRDDENGDDAGSAYLFKRDEGGYGHWTRLKRLTASDGEAGDRFGYAVAVSGDTALVGAFEDDIRKGSAYLFAKDEGGSGNWGQVKKLVASDGEANDYFGRSVALSGDTALVGAEREDSAGAASDSGSAYLFQRDQGGAGNWGQSRKIVAPDAADDDGFGGSVSLSGDLALVGADWANQGGVRTGAAYLFERDRGGSGNWGYWKKLVASDGAANDYFGISVAISGETVLLGAYSGSISGIVTGASYIFERDEGGEGNWGQSKKLMASDGAQADYFGISVAISGDRALVGAPWDDDRGSRSGSAYVFERDMGGVGNWGQSEKLTYRDGGTWDLFGTVALSGRTILVGAQGDDAPSGWGSTLDGRGSAHVFLLSDHGENQDVDNDGIDDLWELGHGLSFANTGDATNNADGDAFDNLAEYIADTDPTNSASFFELESITVNSPAELSWEGSTARVYNVDYRTNLLAGNWQSLVTGVPGSNVMSVVHNTNSPAAFYRIGVSLPTN